MHIEFLVEDSSGAALLEIIIPKIIGDLNNPHTWRIHKYKGAGKIPKGLTSATDAHKRILLDQLPSRLIGYGHTTGIDAAIVVVDTDQRDCAEFLSELQALLARCNPKPNTLFRLAIEEIEAWYLGDSQALLAAYPRAKKKVLANYIPDSVCGTWELLADAVHPKGAAAIKKAGWPSSGQLKHEWAKNIPVHMNINQNVSPSFKKFVEGLRRITSQAAA